MPSSKLGRPRRRRRECRSDSSVTCGSCPLNACGIRLIFAPQARQKLAPSIFCVAHLGQNIWNPPSSPSDTRTLLNETKQSHVSFLILNLVSAGVKLRTKRCRWQPTRLAIQSFPELESAPTRHSARAPDDANPRLPHPEPLPTDASNPTPCNSLERPPPFPRPKRYALSIARSNARY